MKKIVLLYWGKGGNVENAAHKVYEKFDSDTIDIFDLVSFNIDTIKDYSHMILGHSTVGAEDWMDAKADNEWNNFFRKLEKIEKPEITASSFCLGDQILYPDHFVDSLGVYKEEMDNAGIPIIGQWSTEGYRFSDSDGEENGMFYGLALDMDNEFKLSEERIEKWTKELKSKI